MNTTNQNATTEYNGLCAFAVSTGKMDVEGEKYNLTINEKTYRFSNPIAKFLFKILPNRVNKADTNWKNK